MLVVTTRKLFRCHFCSSSTLLFYLVLGVAINLRRSQQKTWEQNSSNADLATGCCMGCMISPYQNFVSHHSTGLCQCIASLFVKRTEPVKFIRQSSSTVYCCVCHMVFCAMLCHTKTQCLRITCPTINLAMDTHLNAP